MCGIAGIFHPKGIGPEDIKSVHRMNLIQKHRGPDDEGTFHDAYCVLGHRRLSIIDLSRDGHQPFVSDDGRYQLVYNGEIYNYIELREELEKRGVVFRTRTDTEVLLKCYEQYGEDCLMKFNGMFAFAVYDTKVRALFLARDRLGVKPLYYRLDGEKLVFASEIKALKIMAARFLSVDRQALFDYLVFNRTDIFDETFYKEIKRLPKGHKAHFRGGELVIKKWWEPWHYLNKHLDLTLRDILPEIERLLLSAVRLRLRSDVKVGACLSGGLDSSILTGIITGERSGQEPFNTFTVTFPGFPFDEVRFVDNFRNKFAILNHRITPSWQAAHEHLKAFVMAQDEPTASSSPYAQYELMQLVRQHGVVVLLDGQGGDENFAGYHYFHGFYLAGLLKRGMFLRFAREFLSVILRGQNKQAYETFLFQILAPDIREQLLMKKVPFIKKDYFHACLKSSRIYNEFFNADSLNTSIARHFQYKLEHLLRVEDRNSMAHSIEARLPYLDYRLVEFLLGIDEKLKIRGGTTKNLQRQALGRYTVQEILRRKDKVGFETPENDWMKTSYWEGLAVQSFDHCKDIFPDVFNRKAPFPREGQERWKMVQLAEWHKISTSNC